MRRIFLVMGIALGVITTAGLLYFNLVNRPIPAEILVAVNDVSSGAVVRAQDFRIARWTDVDQRALSQYVTAREFALFEGKQLNSDVRSGFPLGKSQIDANTPDGVVSRLSVAITGTDSYYFVLPSSPDGLGNWVQPNDRIDVLITIGQLEARELSMPLGDASPGLEQPAAPSLNLMLPATKLVLQNLRVIRVDRDNGDGQSPASAQMRGGVVTYGGAQGSEAFDEPVVRDLKRVYVEVDRDQLEVLTFLKRNGLHDFAVRSPNNTAVRSSDGVAFDDYMRWFFAQRGGDPRVAQPFAGAGSYEPNK
jgi:Flp pilus assembly protein CpaB